MPKNHSILKTDVEIVNWFSQTRFAGDKKAAKKHLRSIRRLWSKNGNRFRSDDEVLLEYRRSILRKIENVGLTILQIQKELTISVNHIKRILAQLLKEDKIGRVREGKAYLYRVVKEKENVTRRSGEGNHSRQSSQRNPQTGRQRDPRQVSRRR